MPDIFISYSRKDKAFADKLAVSLQELGADVFLDVEDISAGEKWSTTIQNGLDNASVMVLVLSPDSMKSTNVEDEWQYFLDKKKPIVPVLHRSTERHFQLGRLQHVDFVAQPFGQALYYLHQELTKRGVKLTPIPTPPPIPRPKAEPIVVPPSKPAATPRAPTPVRSRPAPKSYVRADAADMTKRVLAYGLDILLVFGSTIVVHLILGIIIAALSPWVSFAIAWVGYYTVTIGVLDNSIGKKMFSLKVVSTRGEPISVGRNISRHVIGYWVGNGLGLGFIWAFIREDHRAIHDLFWGTRVVADD